MLKTNLFYFVVPLVTCLIPICWSHVRFVCPRPQSSLSDIFEKFPNSQSSDGECGQDSAIEFDFESEYTVVTPGPMTIRFEETVIHQDSPFSISLHDYDDNTTSCLLLDQIPHNNDARANRYCHVSGYPIGQCKGSTYFITINIPNVVCKTCYLKIKSVHFNVNSKDKKCSDASPCEVYLSCANIRIRPTTSSHGRNLENCQSYSSNLLGVWPYRPRKYFKAEITTAAHDNPILGTAVFDVVMNKIVVGLPRSHFRNGLIKVALSTITNSTAEPPEYNILYSSPISPSDYRGSRINIPFEYVSYNISQLLISGQIYMNIFTDDADYIGQLQMKHEEKGKGDYEPLSTQYNSNGWLSAPEFLGDSATYPSAIYPTGPCAPPSQHFISRLVVPENESDIVGILTLTTIDNFIHVMFKLTDKYLKIDEVVLLAPELMVNRELSVPIDSLDQGFLHATIKEPIWTSKVGTLNFFKTVEIRTDNKVIVAGTMEEGIYTYMGDITKPHGLGIFQITRGKWLQYTIMMKKMECEKQAVLLQVQDSLTSKNLTSDITSKDGHQFVEGYLKELSSDVILSLWNGQVSLVMKCEENNTTFTEIIGKVTRPGEWYCSNVKTDHCSIVKLTPGGTMPLIGETFLPPTGLAAFVLDRAKVLQYSIYIGDVTKRGLLVASLSDEDHLILSINLHRSQTQDKVFEARGQIPQSSPYMISALLLGRLKLHVTNPGIGTLPLLGLLPIVQRSECIESKTSIVGGDKENWSSDSAPFKTIHALVGDKLVFIYGENTTVHLFKSQEDFESCNMKNGISLHGVTTDNITWKVIYKLTSGSTYFASETQCDISPPFKVSVSVIEDDKFVTEGEDDCITSMYQIWRQDQLKDYRGPKVVASALGGIFAGLIVLFILCVVNRKNERKHQQTNSGFQRF